ncbi:MAG: radical SAM protein [Lachnospiraceae bacterium]|nr:radical SAM protein [Lachnospiraceae bacterium]
MYNKVYVEITNSCNMNCSFCHGHKRAPRRMTMEEFALILDKLTDQTKYIYYHLMGEPLTHPLLPEFIKMAGARGYKSIITTNGTLLNGRGEELLSAGVHKINISLHSFENRVGDDFERYVCDLAEFAKNAATQGTIVVFRLWNQGFDGGKNDSALHLLKERISGDWVENTRGIRIRDKIYLEWGERFEWPDSDAEIKGTKFSCYGLKDQFGILSDGTVVPCCLDSDGIIHLGNIFEEDINIILNSKRAVDMVEGFRCGVASEDLCKKCGYAQRFV